MLVLSAGRAAAGCELLVVLLVADGGLMLQAAIKRRSEKRVSIRTGMILISPIDHFFRNILNANEFKLKAGKLACTRVSNFAFPSSGGSGCAMSGVISW